MTDDSSTSNTVPSGKMISMRPAVLAIRSPAKTGTFAVASSAWPSRSRVTAPSMYAI